MALTFAFRVSHIVRFAFLFDGLPNSFALLDRHDFFYTNNFKLLDFERNEPRRIIRILARVINFLKLVNSPWPTV